MPATPRTSPRSPAIRSTPSSTATSATPRWSHGSSPTSAPRPSSTSPRKPTSTAPSPAPKPFCAPTSTAPSRLLQAARAYYAISRRRRTRETSAFSMSPPTRSTARSRPTDPAFHEDTPYAPNSPYAASKAASDHLVRAWHHTYGLPTLITNCSNNYGPFQFPEKLIPLMIPTPSTASRCPSTATASRSATGSLSATTAPPSRAVLAEGRLGRDLQRRRRQPARQPRRRHTHLRACSTSSAPTRPTSRTSSCSPT